MNKHKCATVGKGEILKVHDGYNLGRHEPHGNSLVYGYSIKFEPVQVSETKPLHLVLGTLSTILW